MFTAQDLKPLMDIQPLTTACPIEIFRFDDAHFDRSKARHMEVEIEIHRAKHQAFSSAVEFWRESIRKLTWESDFNVKSGEGLFRVLQTNVDNYNQSNSVYMSGLLSEYPLCTGKFVAAMSMRVDWNEDVSLIETSEEYYAFFWRTLV